jgi:hypothetical protein
MLFVLGNQILDQTETSTFFLEANRILLQELLPITLAGHMMFVIKKL